MPAAVNAGTFCRSNAAVAAQAAHSLRHFFEDNALPAWRAQVSHYSSMMQQHEMPSRGQDEGSLANSLFDVTSAAAPTAPRTAASDCTQYQGSSKGTAVCLQPSALSLTAGPVSGNKETSSSPTAATATASTPAAASQAAGPSHLRSKELSAATQAPLSAPAHHSTARIKAWMRWLWRCLRLLHTGFPDADDERVWQDTCRVTSVQATDPVCLVFQAAVFIVSLMRTWQAGLLTGWSHASNVILYASHGSGWVFAILR
jgi:hypothetical protein